MPRAYLWLQALIVLFVVVGMAVAAYKLLA